MGDLSRERARGPSTLGLYLFPVPVPGWKFPALPY